MKLKGLCTLSLAAMMLGTSIVPTYLYAAPVATTKNINKVPKQVTTALNGAEQYLIKNVSKPQFGSVGGEWAIFGLARRGAKVPKNYYEDYYKHLEQVAKTEHQKKSRKWKTKVTETQRMAIAVAAIGKDPTNVGGVNLIDYSFNKSKHMSDLPEADRALGNRQGANELIFGLIAMNLKNTSQPKTAEITRNQIISMLIKDYHTSDGGFSLSKDGKQGEVDITAMAIQSLAPYYKKKGFEHVTKAVDEALKFLANRQNKSGGFSDTLSTGDDKGTGNCESTVQVIVALSSLGVDPAKDTRFIKNGKTLIDELLSYQLASGGFEHVKGQGINQMATEQGFYALVAYERLLLGKNAIYDMAEMD